MRSVALVNNKGGVGKATLTFNIAHMLARKGLRTVALDYDPQCTLSEIFLADQDLEEIWEEDEASDHGGTAGRRGRTVADCIEPVRRGMGDIQEPELILVAEDLWLLPGHLDLGRFEQTLAEEWPHARGHDNERALRVVTALARLASMAAHKVDADILLIHVGSSLGALNRAALLACDAVVVTLAPDLFSLPGLASMGATLKEWRTDWSDICSSRPEGEAQESLPIHRFHPVGYIVQQHLARVDRISAGYRKWASRIPWYFHHYVLEEKDAAEDLRIEDDAQCIAWIRHSASLAPIAQIARKPIFALEQADGIGGGQLQAVARCRKEFERLVTRLLEQLEHVSEQHQ
jgi:chromosome partitioning protein